MLLLRCTLLWIVCCVGRAVAGADIVALLGAAGPGRKVPLGCALLVARAFACFCYLYLCLPRTAPSVGVSFQVGRDEGLPSPPAEP